MQKYFNYKKQYRKDQQTFESSDLLYRKSLQENLNDKSDYEFLCQQVY